MSFPVLRQPCQKPVYPSLSLNPVEALRAVALTNDYITQEHDALELMQRIGTHLFAHIAKAPQEDDITMLTVQRDS